jgi:tRNA nucleotidyltransferase/poly(A) polymerase
MQKLTTVSTVPHPVLEQKSAERRSPAGPRKQNGISDGAKCQNPDREANSLVALKRSVLLSAVALSLTLTVAHAQDPTIDELKGKIFDARMAQQTFADGLKYCHELNGKNFYFRLRNRILDLEDYLRSLENLVKAQVYNPQKRRPWTLEDAKERYEEVKREAAEDKQKCALVQSLPELEKQLEELKRKPLQP